MREVTIGTGMACPPIATVRAEVRVPLTRTRSLDTIVDAELITFHGLADGREHVAVRLGRRDVEVPLVRVHSECLTGDLFGSARCDCGPQFDEAVERITERGGVLLYMRQEGRGIGLYNKLDAYRLQDQGLNTYEANRALGLGDDLREYTAAAQMLIALGCPEIDLLTNSPDKVAQLRDLGITVRQALPTGVFLTEHNVSYLYAKAAITSHTIDLRELA
jgi:GTP cyclohydrolase II